MKIKEFWETRNVTHRLSFILWMKVKTSSRDCAQWEFAEDVGRRDDVWCAISMASCEFCDQGRPVAARAVADYFSRGPICRKTRLAQLPSLVCRFPLKGNWSETKFHNLCIKRRLLYFKLLLLIKTDTYTHTFRPSVFPKNRKHDKRPTVHNRPSLCFTFVKQQQKIQFSILLNKCKQPRQEKFLSISLIAHTCTLCNFVCFTGRGEKGRPYLPFLVRLLLANLQTLCTRLTFSRRSPLLSHRLCTHDGTRLQRTLTERITRNASIPNWGKYHRLKIIEKEVGDKGLCVHVREPVQPSKQFFVLSSRLAFDLTRSNYIFGWALKGVVGEGL